MTTCKVVTPWACFIRQGSMICPQAELMSSPTPILGNLASSMPASKGRYYLHCTELSAIRSDSYRVVSHASQSTSGCHGWQTTRRSATLCRKKVSRRVRSFFSELCSAAFSNRIASPRIRVSSPGWLSNDQAHTRKRPSMQARKSCPPPQRAAGLARLRKASNQRRAQVSTCAVSRLSMATRRTQSEGTARSTSAHSAVRPSNHPVILTARARISASEFPRRAFTTMGSRA